MWVLRDGRGISWNSKNKELWITSVRHITDKSRHLCSARGLNFTLGPGSLTNTSVPFLLIITWRHSVSIWINRKWLVFMTSSAWGKGEVCKKGHPTFYDAGVNRLFQRISVSRTTKTVVDIYIYTSVSHEVSCLPVHILIKQLKILKVTPISAYLNPIHSPIGHNLLHGCQCCPLDNLCQAVVSQTKGTSSKRIGWGTML